MIILCIKIFLARIVDVSLGTIKSFYVFKQERLISFIISFFEVLIWYYAARSALSMDIDTIFIPISYSLGYATGTYLGTYFSIKYMKGHQTVHIISNKIKKKDLEMIKSKNFGLTSINTEDNKKYLIIEIEKSRLDELKKTINQIDNSSFIFVTETKIVHNGYIK